MCLHNDLSKIPFAHLPKSWIDKSGKQYGWTEVIKLLDDKEKNMKDKAADAMEHITMTLPPLEVSRAASISPDRMKMLFEILSCFAPTRGVLFSLVR